MDPTIDTKKLGEDIAELIKERAGSEPAYIIAFTIGPSYDEIRFAANLPPEQQIALLQQTSILIESGMN